MFGIKSIIIHGAFIPVSLNLCLVYITHDSETAIHTNRNVVFGEIESVILGRGDDGGTLAKNQNITVDDLNICNSINGKECFYSSTIFTSSGISLRFFARGFSSGEA